MRIVAGSTPHLVTADLLTTALGKGLELAYSALTSIVFKDRITHKLQQVIPGLEIIHMVARTFDTGVAL